MAKLATLFERRWLRRTCYAIAGTFVVLVLALWLGGPPAARWAIETVGSRELGRTVRVGKIRVNPFTLTIRIDDLAIEGAPGESTPLLAIGAMRANLTAMSIWHRAPVIQSLNIDRINAHIVQLDANRFNFSDIVDRIVAKAASKPETKPSSDEPARFALHNIEIADSSIDFDDHVRAQTHTLQQIRIAIPFISSLPTDVEIYVKPAFAAQLDGHPIELSGETRPFETSLETSVDLKIDGLDIPKYLAFSPVPLHFKVPRGALDADLRIAFRRAAPGAAANAARPLQLLISGPVAVRDFELDAPAGADAKRLVAWKRLGIVIDEFSVFDNRLRVREVALEGPEVDVARDGAGRLNWLEFVAAPVAAPKQAADKPADTAKPQPFDASIASLRIADGRARFSDATVGTFVKQLDAITLDAHDISTVDAKPATLKLAVHTADGESIGADGEVRIAQRNGKVVVAAKEIDVKALAPYLDAAVQGRVEARVDAGATVEFDAGAEPAKVRASEISVNAHKLLVEGTKEAAAKLEATALAIEGAAVDLATRNVEVGKVAIDTPRATVTRLRDGTIGWTHLASTNKAPAGKAAGDTAADSASTTPWKVHIAEAELNRGDVHFNDRTVEPAVAVQMTSLNVKARDLSADGSQQAQLNARARIGKTGTVAVDGHVRWDRLAAVLHIDARNLEVPVLRSYIAQALNVEFASAEVSTRGTLTLATVRAKQTIDYRGDARVANLHVLNPGGGGDLLKWELLTLDRCAVRIGEEVPVVEIGAIALSDFFARVVLSQDGTLNLREVTKPTGGDDAAAAPKQATSAPKPTIRIGGITFERGNVNYTDNFINPNYTANLTNFGGTVGALSSDNEAPAEADLKAQLDNDAPVVIKGKLNPLAPQLFLDIAASAKGVDLPRFTPYSAKYAGYPITKGKLSLDVNYKVDNGKLTATNHLFLDQLTFGDHVDSPSATKLPVLFAVSLLKNSRGEININLPISGSLNDPQFSVGGIILGVLVNLITKAVTAPFALLASAFGGNGEEIGYVEFEPGSATIASSQEQRLTTLAKALADRPALRLDVIGRVDPAKDTEALRQARYQAKLRAAKVRELMRSGGASVNPASVKVDAAERPALIESVYSDEKLPNKPRNFLGVAKSVPTQEMEQLLLAAITIGPDDMRKLAIERADAVRNELETTGKIARDRMFLVEPKLTPEGITDKGATTRVDFSIK